MPDNLAIIFQRITRFNNDTNCYRMFTRVGCLRHEKTFPNFGPPEPHALGPHGTLITQRRRVRIGTVISTVDINDVFGVIIIIEGKVEPAEREVILWNVTNLLGLENENDWNMTVFENCKESLYINPDDDSKDNKNYAGGHG